MLTKTKRRVLFALTIPLFVVIATPTIFLALGYKVVGPSWQIQKTGGVFIQASESSALVSIDEKHRKPTSFISKSAFIKQLDPGIHAVSVRKDGFWEWKKYLDVPPETVLWRDVLLIPKDPSGIIFGTSTPVTKQKTAFDRYLLKKKVVYENLDGKLIQIFTGVKNFWELPASNSILLLGEDNNFYEKSRLLDVSTSSPDFLGLSSEVVAVLPALLKTKDYVLFDETESRIIYWDGHTIGTYWIQNTDKLPQWQKTRSVHILTSPTTIEQVVTYPDHPDYILVVTSGGIWALEAESAGGQNMLPIYKGKNPRILQKNAGSLLIQDDKFYFEIRLPG